MNVFKYLFIFFLQYDWKREITRSVNITYKING